MKKPLALSIPVILFILFTIISTGCSTTSSAKDSIEFSESEILERPGKIYLYDDYIFINEKEKGVHIYDLSQPENPVCAGFLSIPGNVDVAMRNGILYADSRTDLLVIDVRLTEQPKLVKRVKNLFPEPPRMPLIFKILLLPLLILAQPAGEPSSAESRTGEGGSMARFAIVDNYLYVLGGDALKLLDLSDPLDPVLGHEVVIGWDIETLFPYGDKLFIGGREGMYIFDNRDKGNPAIMSRFRHVTSCDPVVVEGHIAYVTLRSGSGCGAVRDQLLIIDIADCRSPLLLCQYPMDGPFGLAISDGILYVCDGRKGLKILDVSNPRHPEILGREEIHLPYDIILSGGNAIISAVDGLHIYRLNGSGVMNRLSSIPVSS